MLVETAGPHQVLSLWWVFPVAVAISSVALSTGISGALFFSPFFLLVVGLPAAQAIGAGLTTELFGTSAATMNYVRQRVVDFSTVRYLLPAAVPMGMAGALVANRIHTAVLQGVFGVTLVGLSIIMLVAISRRGHETAKPKVLEGASRITVIKARDGQEYVYPVSSRPMGMLLASIGGALTGLMSAGLPEITTTQLILRSRIPPRVAVATSIFVLTITAFSAAGIHALAGQPAWHVVVWSIPGVLVGGQIGPRLQGKVPSRITDRALAVLFMAVGALVVVLRFI